MRILMLNNEFPPLGGGTASATKALLTELSSKPGIEIELLTASGSDRDQIDDFAPNIKVHRLPVKVSCLHHASGWELIQFSRHAGLRAGALHRERPFDVTFAWCTLPAGYTAWRLWKKFRLPYIVRTSGPDLPGHEARYKWIYPLLTPLLQVIWRGAKAVLGKCARDKEVLRKYVPSSDVRIIPNGVDSKEFSPEARPENDPVKILCVARIVPIKGQIELAHAFRRLVDRGTKARLIFAGTGDSEESLRRTVRALGLDDSVDLLGYVPRERLPALYRSADLFALNSYNESMSIATLEALASGLPAVVTDVGGMDQLILPGKNGFVVPVGARTELADALEKLCTSPALRAEFSAAARLHALQFDWSSTAQGYLGLLSEAAALR